MHFSLRPGVSFCRVGDRLIFLDRKADRYFGVALALEQELLEARDGHGQPTGLLESGLVIESSEAACPILSTHHVLPEAGLLEQLNISAPNLLLARAIAGQLRARADIACRGFDWALRSFERLKDKVSETGRQRFSDVATIASSHHRSRLITTSTSRCLPNSLALARHLVSNGYEARLVLGVKLRPFGAHCWVEHEGLVVSDQLEMIQPFTPILAI